MRGIKKRKHARDERPEAERGHADWDPPVNDGSNGPDASQAHRAAPPSEPPSETTPEPDSGGGRRRRRRTLASVGRRQYDGFISYSHGTDLDIAPVLRDGLQKMAKPWNRRRALSIFLDQSSLELSPELRGALDRRIANTRWLVLLMSEASARSKWVGAEIEAWTRMKGSNEQLALVLTSGMVEWDAATRDFDYETSTAVNPAMSDLYRGQQSEPLFLDLRWTKELPDGERGLDLRNAKFRDSIATVAAPIHGKSKDEIEGEDIRQHRRFVRIRRVAVLSLMALTVAAAVGFVRAEIQRRNAVEQSQRAESRAIAGDALNAVETETDLSALLALESVRVKNTTDARGGLVSLLSQPTRFLQRTAVHDDIVAAIAFDQAGRIAVTGDESGVLRVWDVDPDPYAVPQAIPRAGEIDIGFEVAEIFLDSEDGVEFVLVLDTEGSLWFIDLAAPADLGVIDPPSPFAVAAVGVDSDIVAGVTEDGSVQAYRLVFDDESDPFGLVDDQPGAVESMIGPYGQPPALAVSPDGTLVAWSDGVTFASWRLDGSAEPEYRRVASEVTSLAVSPDGSTLVVGETNGTIGVYDTTDLDASEIAEPASVNHVFDLAFKPEVRDDGSMTLASVHSNGDVQLWTVLPAQGFLPFALLEESLLGHTEEAREVGFSPDGRIASGDYDGEVIWWNDVPVPALGVGQLLPAGEVPEDALPGEYGDVVTAAFTDDGGYVALDDLGRVFTGDPSRDALTELPGSSPATSLDAAGGVIAIGRSDGADDLADTAGDLRATIDDAHDGAVAAIALSADAGRVLTAGADGAVVWDVDREATIAEIVLPDDFDAASVLFEAGRVWIGGNDGDNLAALLAFDAATGAPGMTVRHNDNPGNFVSAIAVTADGRTLATGASDRSIKLWETETLADRREEFRGHRGTVTGIGFWDDDETLITSDDAGAVILWDVSQRQRFADLGGPGDGITSLDVDPVSKLVLAASEDDAVWTWTLDQQIWRERACELAGRNMTDAEWQRHGSRGTKIRHCPEFAIDGEFREAEYTDRLTD